MIENTLANHVIAERLAARGYGVTALTEGQRLHRAAIAAIDTQDAAERAAKESAWARLRELGIDLITL